MFNDTATDLVAKDRTRDGASQMVDSDSGSSIASDNAKKEEEPERTPVAPTQPEAKPSRGKENSKPPSNEY